MLGFFKEKTNQTYGTSSSKGMCSYAMCNGINSHHLLFLRVAWLIHHAHTNGSVNSNGLMVSGNPNNFGVLWEHSLLTADKKWDKNSIY